MLPTIGTGMGGRSQLKLCSVYLHAGGRLIALFAWTGLDVHGPSVSMLEPIRVTDVRLNSASPASKESSAKKGKKRVQFTRASRSPPFHPSVLTRNSSPYGRQPARKEAEDTEKAGYPDSEDGHMSKNECLDLAARRTRKLLRRHQARCPSFGHDPPQVFQFWAFGQTRRLSPPLSHNVAD